MCITMSTFSSAFAAAFSAASARFLACLMTCRSHDAPKTHISHIGIVKNIYETELTKKQYGLTHPTWSSEVPGAHEGKFATGFHELPHPLECIFVPGGFLLVQPIGPTLLAQRVLLSSCKSKLQMPVQQCQPPANCNNQ